MKKQAKYQLKEEINNRRYKKNHLKNGQIFWTKSNISSSLTSFLKNFQKYRDFVGPHSKTFEYLSLKLKFFLPQEIKEQEKNLIYISRISKLFEHQNSINLILNVLKYKKYWKRDLTSWKPKTYNREKAEVELIQHLFEKYSVPTFLYNFWLENDDIDQKFQNQNRYSYIRKIDNDLYRKLLIELGEGISLRKIQTPIFIDKLEITKKFAYYFNQVPKNYISIDQASLFCVLKICHVPDNLIPFIVESDKIQNLLQNYNFWKEIWAYFANNPMINPVQLGPIIDYVYNLKFIERVDYKINHRNPLNLLIAIDEWHQKLAERDIQKVYWKGFDIKNYEPLKENPNSLETFTITQIKSSINLKLEGKELRHCVFSYLNSCVKEQTSIWSYKEFGVRTLTIALAPNGNITQVRGKCNRVMNLSERKNILKWVSKNNLKLY